MLCQHKPERLNPCSAVNLIAVMATCSPLNLVLRDIKYVKKMLPRQHQTLFFSVTINDEIRKLAYSQIKSPAIRIQASPEDKVSKKSINLRGQGLLRGFSWFYLLHHLPPLKVSIVY